MDTTIPSGIHKGRQLHELTKAEFDALRNGWNGSPMKRDHPFFEVIESHAKTRVSRPVAPQKDDRAEFASKGVMYFGAHRGKHVSDLSTAYLHFLLDKQATGLMKPAIEAELLDRNEPHKSQPKPKRKPTSLAATHYAWTDPTGRVCMIPNEISMEGRENEECPFDMPEPEPYREEVTDLDREFRAICGL